MTTISVARRCAVATLAGFAALSLAACGSSNTHSDAHRQHGQADKSADGKARVMGLVNSVSGSTVSVAGKNGPSTVDVTPSTHITQFSAGQLTDIKAGECIAVHPVKNNPTTAAEIMFGQADNAQCGSKDGDRQRGVGGTVASVNGNSIVVMGSDKSQSTVTVTPQTHYIKRAGADVSAITTGVCLAARGTKDSSGVLQATDAMVRPANNGACGGGHQRR